MTNEILGENIRKNRLALNWTQEKLADILCVSHQVISKWENGIATPDIATICSLAKIFNISLDGLCGFAPEQSNSIILEIEYEINKNNTTYDFLYARWKEVEKELVYYPINDDLLYAALKLLHAIHSRVETDQQKETVNADILKISERLLDFSRNDAYRSFANFNLAIYYSEQVHINRNDQQDIENARKAKAYAELVLYKDMPHAFYLGFGATTTVERRDNHEETLIKMVSAAKSACRNLIHFSRHFPAEVGHRSKIYTDVSVLLNEIEIKLSSC